MVGGVKGTAIESVVADVNRLVEAGGISRAELEVRLEADDLELLEQKLLPSAWYSLGSYGRLMQLLFETEGRRRIEYLVERGRRAAERIRNAGLYAQLAADRDRWGDRLGAMMVTIGPAMYRDTEWSFRLLTAGGGLRFEIEISVPESFPDVCRHATQGFIEYTAAHASGQSVRVSSERVGPTRIMIRTSTS
jgi:hypothetical protein